jgi:DICT domain-containing protein
MTFTDIIESVNGSRARLTALNVDAPPQALTRVADFFDPLHVEFVTDDTETGRPRNVALLHREDTLLAASDLADVYERVDVETGLHTAPDLDDVAYPDVLQVLDHTTFSEFGKTQMIIASREIEKRAWKRGSGRLHTGFQRLSLLASQERIYRKLGDSPVETHVYGISDGPVPDTVDVTVHGIDTQEIARSWFVVFDGAGDDDEKCGLFAEEVGENVYNGFLTYDPTIVDEMLHHLGSIAD